VRGRITLAFILPLLVREPVGRAQDAVSAAQTHDEWVASFRGRKKIGWYHETVEERRDPAVDTTTFVVLDEGVQFSTDGDVHRLDRVETDSGGRVVRFVCEITTPWGDTHASAERSERGLNYRVQIRGESPVEGALEECWDSSVLTRLVMSGVQPTGKRTVRCLALPGDGTKDEQLDIEREADGWKIQDERVTTRRTREGAFVRSESGECPDQIILPTTEVNARDRAITRPDGGEALDLMTQGWLRVRRPGLDWSLRRGELQRGAILIESSHACGIGAHLLVMPVRLPADERERLRMADSLRTGLNKERETKPTNNGPTLGPPTALAWHGRPAASFVLGGRIGQAEIAGEAILVGLPDGWSTLMLFGGPKDLVGQRAAILEAAQDAVDVAAPSESQWERVTLGRASLEVPRSWQRQEQQARMRSALGISQLLVMTDRLPPGWDQQAAQDDWVKRMRANTLYNQIVVERRSNDAVVGDRRCYLTTLRGRVEESKGRGPAMRCASCSMPRKDGTYVAVVILAFDVDLDLGAVDRMLDSIRWIDDG